MASELNVEQFSLAHQIQSHAKKIIQSCHGIAQ